MVKRFNTLKFGFAVAVSAIAFAVVPAGAAAARRPVVVHFALSGSVPREEGGLTAVSIRVHGATRCSITGPSAVIGGEWTGRCSAHTRAHKIWLPANTKERAEHYTLTLTARGPGGVTRRRLTVVVPGEAKLAVGLWLLTITELGAPAGESLPIELLADGIWTGENGKVTGVWSYAHHEIHLSFPGNVAISAVGGAKGPLTNSDQEIDTGSEILQVSIRLERAGNG